MLLKRMRLCITLVFVMPAILSHAQQNAIDSVNAIIKTATNDTTIARAYLTISSFYYPAKLDTLITLANQSIELVNKNLDKANPKEKHSYLLTKAAALTNIGTVKYFKGQIDSALAYYKKGLDLQIEIHEDKEVANSYNNIGAIYLNTGKVDEALEYLEKGLKMQEKIGTLDGMAVSYGNIGAIYENKGQTQKALDYYFKGLKLLESLKNKDALSSAYNNIAALFARQDEVDKALEFYNKSIKLREEKKDKRGLGQCYNNIGMIYLKQKKDTATAVQYFNQSFELYKSVENKQGIAYVLNNLGAICKGHHNNKEAMEYFQESYATYKSIEDKRGMATTLNNISEILNTEKKTGDALAYSRSALEIAQASGFADLLRDIYANRATIEEALGHDAEALKYYKRHIVIRDSIVNQETQKTSIRKQMQYDYEKQHEKELQELEKQELLRNEKLKRERLINIGVAAGLVLLLVTTLLFFNRFRLKKKNELQTALAQKKKEQAVAVMETQEQERKRIAEDLHDSLGHLLSTAKFNIQTIDSAQKDLVKNSLSLLDQASEELRSITFNLMPRTLEEGGLIAALEELANKVTASGRVKVFLNIHDMERFALDKQSQFNVYRIVQEAVNNILKHADAKEINIQLIGQEKHFTIMIEDDGKGFDKNNSKNGRGLKNIVTRSLWLNGSINIDSSPGKGTTIITEIPS